MRRGAKRNPRLRTTLLRRRSAESCPEYPRVIHHPFLKFQLCSQSKEQKLQKYPWVDLCSVISMARAPIIACVVACIALCVCQHTATAAAMHQPGEGLTTSAFQVVCNDTNVSSFDARCNQSSSACTTTSLPFHICLNSTVHNVSVKVLDCFPYPMDRYPPSIVVAVFDGTELCEGVAPVIQHQPAGPCILVGENEYVQNICSDTPLRTDATQGAPYFQLAPSGFVKRPGQ